MARRAESLFKISVISSDSGSLSRKRSVDYTRSFKERPFFMQNLFI